MAWRREGRQDCHEGRHLLKVGGLRLSRPIGKLPSSRTPTTYGSLYEGRQLAKRGGWLAVFGASIGGLRHRGSLQVQPPRKVSFSDTTRRRPLARSRVRFEKPLASAAASTLSA